MAQSVEALRLNFPRMARQIREQGVTQIPSTPFTGDAAGKTVTFMPKTNRARRSRSRRGNAPPLAVDLKPLRGASW